MPVLPPKKGQVPVQVEPEDPPLQSEPVKGANPVAGQ